MPIRIVGARISSSNGPTGSLLCLLANWNKSGSGIAQSYASAQATSLPWIHNRVNPRHQLPVASIIRQFSLAPFLLSQRATVAPSSKHQPQYQDKSQHKGKKKGRNPLWTLEEDIILYNCLQENKPTVDFYHQFPGRSVGAVCTRAHRLRDAYFVPPEKGGLVEDADMTVAQRVEALRRIRRYTASESKAEGVYTARTKSTHMNYTGSYVPFSEEEKEMLAKLVYKYHHDPGMWARVSGGRLVDEEGAPRLNRTPQSCKSAWRAMNRDESIKLGTWDKHELRRLVKAIGGQVGDEYEICLGVKEEGSDGSNQSATATSEPTTKPVIRMGSPVLQRLNWKKIASKVRTRTASQCQNRFYLSTHNGKAGTWATEEVERLLEGYKLYGRQWDKISVHIGTRSSHQARMKYLYIQSRAEKS